MSKQNKAMVYLVGAGPGDPGLLTLRAAQLLRRADVVVYDALVGRGVMRMVPASAEVVYAGKRAKEHAIPQEKLNDLLIQKAQEGKVVVRLKGGDPYVFGRGGEEAEALAEAGIGFEVVPGISSAVAGPSYAGIPVTHREICSSFTVFTGHEDPDKEEAGVDWEAVAHAPGTKVVLMGVKRMREVADALIRHGVPKEMPVAVVRWGTTGRQETLEGTLETMADLLLEKNFKPPAVTVIGEVVKLRSKLNWYERRPLFGQRVVVTRARGHGTDMAERFTELGADVLEIPVIRQVAPENKEDLKDALLGLNSYDWIVFTSASGVVWFFEWFFKGFDDMRDLGGCRIAAVGPATAAKVREYRLKVDLMPESFTAASVAEAFSKYQSIENLRILLMRAETANRDLPRQLEEMGAIVDDVACYQTVPETDDPFGAAKDFIEHGADWITFTSGSTVENFLARFPLGELAGRFPGMKIASIGPETTKALKTHNLAPHVEAAPHTSAALIEAITSRMAGRKPE